MKNNKLLIYFLQTFLIAGLSVKANAQQNIQAIADTLIRPTPLIGFNSNGHFGTLNWTNQQFIDSVGIINPGIRRQFTIRPEEFQNGLNAANAESLFVLNYRNSTVINKVINSISLKYFFIYS